MIMFCKIHSKQPMFTVYLAVSGVYLYSVLWESHKHPSRQNPIIILRLSDYVKGIVVPYDLLVNFAI